MKISDNTSISMPMRNLIGLIMAIGIGIFAYSDLTQRLTELETARQLMEADLLKKAEQTPVDQEQYMLLEFIAGQFEVMETEVQSIESNNINIEFIKTQLEKMQNDVEILNYTDYSGIVIRKEKSKISLIKNYNVFISKSSAPEGWVEILTKINKEMERKNI